MNKENEDKLFELFCVIFELDPSIHALEITQDRIDQWDSLSHVTLITAIENEFDVFMDIEDAQSMTSYQEALKLIDRLRS